MGIVTNIMLAACNTSGTDWLTPPISAREEVWLSVADATIWYSLYWISFRLLSLV